MGLIDKMRDLALGARGSSRDYGNYDYDEYEDDYEYDDYDSAALRDTVRPLQSERQERQPERHEAVLERPVRGTSQSASSSGGRSTVLSIHTNVQMQVVISYPETVDEAGSICEYVKANKTVVVNLENVKHEMAQRIVDFLGGVSYALEGDIQYVSNKIFLVAPKNVDISGNFKEELKANGVLFNFKQPLR